jgi:lipopolysaccharide export system protein LptA
MWKLPSSLAGTALFFSVAAAVADTGATTTPSPEDARTTITSQRMTVRNQENKAIFEGAVILTKGALVVHSDVMVVFFKPVDPPSGKPSDSAASTMPGPMAAHSGARSEDLPVMSNRAVSTIEATGKVKIFKADGQATCRKAVYDGATEKIVLTGEPVAWQKGTRVTGQKITMFLAEDRSVVEGGSHVMIEPEGGSAR